MILGDEHDDLFQPLPDMGSQHLRVFQPQLFRQDVVDPPGRGVQIGVGHIHIDAVFQQFRRQPTRRPVPAQMVKGTIDQRMMADDPVGPEAQGFVNPSRHVQRDQDSSPAGSPT